MISSQSNCKLKKLIDEFKGLSSEDRDIFLEETGIAELMNEEERIRFDKFVEFHLRDSDSYMIEDAESDLGGYNPDNYFSARLIEPNCYIASVEYDREKMRQYLA